MHRTGGNRVWPLAVLALALLLVVVPAAAQTTTVTLRGAVNDQTTKKGVGAATVLAQSKTTGFHYSAVTSDEGAFVLAGLPPGPYDLSVQAPSYKAQAKQIDLQLGQTVNLVIEVSPESLMVENVSVVGNRLVETRTSVVATNVTPEQIELLPQNNRNFLNFAQLAPGVRVTDDQFNKQYRALGQPANSTNVFVDGISYKNDVLEGGVVGQDASRGNPFPQNAVQEFQVLTQNFKAEYEKASTGVITAVTKTGGNSFDGSVFLEYQPKSFVSRNFFDRMNDVDKPDYKRFQGGLDIGGPIIKEKLTFFFSFEENHQNRAARVALGTNPDAGFDDRPLRREFEGSFTSPFRSRLYFGKLSWQPALDQTVELTLNRRDESDKRGFGGQNAGTITTFERGENIDVEIDTAAVKHKLMHETFLNEASVQWQRMDWNPKSITSTPQINYFGFAELGSRNGDQKFRQDRLSFRDDLTFYLNGAGTHSLKSGLVVSLLKYDVTKMFGGNGTLNFNFDPGNGHSFANPFEGFISAGDPSFTARNKELGLYIQDDWNATRKLSLNLGIRWDYETDMVNSDFVTPSQFRSDLSGDIAANGLWNHLSESDRQNYFSTGSNRDGFKKAFQPRVGFSYDFTAEGRSVLFGGVGRYYDRDIYNVFFDEKFRKQYRTYRFCFYSNATEQANCGPQGVAWDPSFEKKGALLELLNSGQVQGKPEIFLIPADLKVPYNDQASLGYRQRFGGIIGEIAGTYIRGKNGFTYVWGNRDFGTGNLSDVSARFSNLLLGTDDKEYWYRGVYVKFERQLADRWGFTFTYTLSKAEQRGNDAFSLDYFTVDDYPKSPTPDDERHRIVATGIVRIPWNVTFSSNLILGSGLPYYVFDASEGFGFTQLQTRADVVRPRRTNSILGKWAYRQLDLRAQKTFGLGKGQSLSVDAEVFNVFNWDNFSDLDNFVRPKNDPAGPNPTFGEPRNTIGPTRSFQVGLKYGF